MSADVTIARGQSTATSAATTGVDILFDGAASQAAVYAKVKEALLSRFLAGVNATVFVYGATGTGKTYTVMGGGSDTEAAGIAKRISEDAFRAVDGRSATVRVSCVEVLDAARGKGATVTDLLAVPTANAKKKKEMKMEKPSRHRRSLRITRHATRHVTVPPGYLAPTYQGR